MKALDNLYRKIDEFIESDSQDMTDILSTKGTIVEKFKDIKNLDTEIFELIVENGNDEELEVEEEEATNFLQLFKKKLYLIENFKKTEIKESSDTKAKNSGNIKLPSTSIKPFNGDPQTWQTFIDSLDCATHSNKNLNL